MPNAFLTPDKIARVTAALVSQDLGLAALVHRDLDAEFNSGSSDTVKVRVPGAVPSRTRGIYDVSTPLSTDAINEQSIDVKLTEHAYSNIVLSEGDMSLEIDDFAGRVLRPQASAIVKHVERAVASLLQATPENTTLAYSAAAPAKTFTQMRKVLRDNGVSADAALVAVVGSGVYADLLDAAAIDDTGAVRGFKIVESNRLADDEIVGFVREAFALVVRAPIVPDGAPYGASVSEEGFALRHIRSFDPTIAADRSLVSAFLGTKALPLAVDNEDGTVSLVANGGAVRVLTAA